MQNKTFLKLGFRFVLPLLAFAGMLLPLVLLFNGAYPQGEGNAAQLIAGFSLPILLSALLMMFVRPSNSNIRKLLPGYRNYYVRESMPAGHASAIVALAFSALPLLALGSWYYIIGYFAIICVLATTASYFGRRAITAWFKADYDAGKLHWRRYGLEQLVESDAITATPEVYTKAKAALARNLNLAEVEELVTLLKKHISLQDAQRYLEDNLSRADELRSEAQENINEHRRKLDNTFSRLKLLG